MKTKLKQFAEWIKLHSTEVVIATSAVAAGVVIAVVLNHSDEAQSDEDFQRALEMAKQLDLEEAEHKQRMQEIIDQA